MLSSALPTFQPTKLKTYLPQPQTFNDIDSENIDPSNLKSSNKLFTYPSKPTSTTDNMNAFKPAQFILKAATAATLPTTNSLRPLAQTIGSKRKAESAPSASEVESERPLKSPRKVAALPPAGRSPKSKRAGILSRHRTSASPFTRVDPPTFGAGKGNSLPFSIDAALAGTVPSTKLRKPARTKELVAETVLESMPKGWMFQIHEDSKDEEATNLMNHSTCTLDISDDEGSSSKMNDEDNKENIPPHPGMNAPVSAAIAAMHASRKHMMTDEPRSPLGELEASDYYAAGCDANSYITIPGDEDVKANTKNEILPEASTIYTGAKIDVEAVNNDITWNDLVEMAKPTNKSTGLTPLLSAMNTHIASSHNALPVIHEDSATTGMVAEGVAVGNVV